MVLVSGGVESAALLSYWAHWDHGQRLLPLFVDYGQKNARAEEAAQQVGMGPCALPKFNKNKLFQGACGQKNARAEEAAQQVGLAVALPSN